MKQGPLKKIHIPHGTESLECQCLRDGTLDVNLRSGEVFSLKRSKRKRMTLSEDRDGYLHVHLARERGDRRGKPEVEFRNGKRIKRYRRRRYVRVNRLVKMKSIAVGLGGAQWRRYVKDLPRGVDVNHDNQNRADNHHMNLTLETELANRTKRPMTAEEQAEINACAF